MNLNVNSRMKQLLNKDAHETNRKETGFLFCVTQYTSLLAELFISSRLREQDPFFCPLPHVLSNIKHFNCTPKVARLCNEVCLALYRFIARWRLSLESELCRAAPGCWLLKRIEHGTRTPWSWIFCSTIALISSPSSRADPEIAASRSSPFTLWTWCEAKPKSKYRRDRRREHQTRALYDSHAESADNQPGESKSQCRAAESIEFGESSQ